MGRHTSVCITQGSAAPPRPDTAAHFLSIISEFLAVIHVFVYIFPHFTYMSVCMCVFSCVLEWFPLLEAVCGGLEQCFVFVLVVWCGAL